MSISSARFVAGELREPVLRVERTLGSIALVAHWHWDHLLDKDAEARKLSTAVKKMGEKVTDATLRAFLRRAHRAV